MNKIINVCLKCTENPEIIIQSKTRTIQIKCYCGDQIISFSDYLTLMNQKRNNCFYCETSFFHLFYPMKGYCEECNLKLCSSYLQEHSKEHPNHFISPCIIKTLVFLKNHKKIIQMKKLSLPTIV